MCLLFYVLLNHMRCLVCLSLCCSKCSLFYMLLNVFVILCVAQSYVLLSVLVIMLLKVLVILYVAQRVCYSMCCSFYMYSQCINIAQCANVFNGLVVVLCVA